jgi:Mor family transcriptional regulator
MRYREVLKGCMEAFTQCLLARPDVPNESAHAIAQDLVEIIRQDWGGVQVYFPHEKSIELEQRNTTIWAEYSEGLEISEICRRHRIGKRQFRRIISSMSSRK